MCVSKANSGFLKTGRSFIALLHLASVRPSLLLLGRAFKKPFLKGGLSRSALLGVHEEDMLVSVCEGLGVVSLLPVKGQSSLRICLL